MDAETQSAVAALNDLTRTLAEAETKMAAAAELRLVPTPQFLILKLLHYRYKFVKNLPENESGKIVVNQSTKFNNLGIQNCIVILHYTFVQDVFLVGRGVRSAAKHDFPHQKDILDKAIA